MAEHSRVFTCKFYIQDRTELAGADHCLDMTGYSGVWRGPYKYISRLQMISTVLLALTEAGWAILEY